MKINLISKKEHSELITIHKNHPNLFLQNTGYEYLNKNTFSEKDKESFKRVTEILRKSIHGFLRFDNFRIQPSSKKLQLRFQYNWNYDKNDYFSGVGYILVDELLNGFSPKEFLFVEFIYTDASNYKDFFRIQICREVINKNKLTIGTEVTMGTFGTPSVKEFFESSYHKDPYDPNYDHNILEIYSIESE